MADKARRYTDRQLAQMEKHITEIYAQATDEITAKWEKYMANAEKRVSGLQKEYDEAVKRGDKDEIEKAKARLDKAKYNETLANARYKEMVDQTTTQMSMANQMAVAYMNGQMPNIYVANYNQLGSDANAMGVSYTLLDENTLSRAIKGEIPRKTINVPKDKRWNEKYINSQVTQGIIQGESMDKIAKRIFPEIMDKSDFSNLTEEEKNKLIQRNKNSSIRAARTMVTGVENLGRLDGMKQLESEGIIQKKVWMATPDDRTRESHIDIDGEEQDLNEYFSNGCMFPGDGDGPHEEVWNCRCSMRTHIVGIRRKDGTIKQVDYGMQGAAHEDAIDEEKERRGLNETKEKRKEDTKKKDETKKQDNERKENKFEQGDSKEITKSEWDEIERYVSGDDMWINNYLRGRGDFGDLTEEEQERLELLDKATSKNPIAEKLLYRSVDAEAVFGQMSQSEYENLKEAIYYGTNNKFQAQALENAQNVIGKQQIEKGFMSTTADKDVAFYWGEYTGSEKPVVLVLDVQEGVCGVDVRRFEVKGDEQDERLLQRDLKFEVTKIEMGQDSDGENAAIFVFAKLMK